MGLQSWATAEILMAETKPGSQTFRICASPRACRSCVLMTRATRSSCGHVVRMTTAGQLDDGGFGFPIMRKRFLPEQPDQRVDFAFQLCDALIARGKFLVAPRDDERGDGLAQHVVTGVWLRVGRHRRGGGARLC